MMENINKNIFVVAVLILLLQLGLTESRDGDVWLTPTSTKINSTFPSGILYIFHNGGWGTICDDDAWSMENTQVVCKALGYARAVEHKNMGGGTGKIWLSGVRCLGTEASVASCAHSGWENASNCSHKQDVGIVCQAAPIATVRLSGGNRLEGRVEVRYNKEWGTICKDGWNINNANVICKMLGHKKAIKTKSFGPGSGRIWLDDVACKGTEMSIDKCHHRGWGIHNCAHREDSGVMCLPRGPSNVSVRLVGSDLPNAGRVEIRFHGVWKSVCDTKWDLREANVICLMLGYIQGAAVAIKGYKSAGDVWLSSVSCNGGEKSIERCKNLKWGKASCRNDRRAGVVCKSGTPEIAYRLVDGDIAHKGRLEAYYYGIWGAVCADTIDIQDAHVVCRMMGYSQAVTIYKQSGDSFKFLSKIHCNGNENSTEQCNGAKSRINTCRSKKDTWIICKPKLESKKVQARLVGGATPNKGRLEIQQYGVWGTVCNSGWNIMDANVACRMMNFTGAISVRHQFVHGTGPIWLTNINCKGDEKNLLECSHDGLGNTSFCSHGNDVGVVCHSYPAQKPIMAVRLVDGNTPNQGRVEIRYFGVWGTICDDLWGLEDAHVVCRMLNYSKALWAGTADVSGSGYILLDNVQCSGNERSLEHCANNSLGQHDCGHKEDAGVICDNLTQDELAVTARLVKTQRKHVGQVEVKYKGTWRPVCDDTWDILDAHVVCRMLGYKGAEAPIRQYAKLMSNLWMSGVVCRGDEESVSHCFHRGWTNTRCPGNYYAGVICKVDEGKEIPSVQVRLEDGKSPNSGRVAVRYGNVWGTICRLGLDINDAKVICRMLGYPGASKVYPKSTIRPGNGTIWLSNLECNGTEDSIVDCRHPGWGETITCNHENDVAVMCQIADAPGFQINGTTVNTESTVLILFNDSQQIGARLKSVYQVAVEKRGNEQRSKSYEQPPPFVYNEVNVTMATHMGNDSYISAEILRSITNLTIGDGQYYHGYYNAPLEPGSMYRVHVRIVTMAMDGKRIYGKSAFVAFTTKPGDEFKIKYYKDTGNRVECTNNAVVIALSLVIVFMVIVIIVGVVWYCLKNRNSYAIRNKSEGVEMKESGNDSHNDTP